MDVSPVLLMAVIGTFGLIVVGSIISSVSRSLVRPSDHDSVQMNWSDRRRLESESVSAGFWRFVAKLEFFMLVIAAITIWILWPK